MQLCHMIYIATFVFNTVMNMLSRDIISKVPIDKISSAFHKNSLCSLITAHSILYTLN